MNVSPVGGAPCGLTTTPSFPWPFWLKLCLTVIGKERFTFCEQQSSPHPPTTIGHGEGGGSPTEEFLIFVLFIFFGHRPTTPGCRAKATHCWPAQAPSEKGDTVLIRPGVQYQSKV